MLRATSRAKKVQGKLTHVFPSVSRSNKLARASRRKEVPCCANQQPPFHRNPVVFRPASQTCPPGYFDPVDKYENPYKKELPVGHWNSQYLEDPDAWWGDAGKSDDGSIGGRSGGSGGGLGSGSGGGWEFEDDDEYDEAALGLLVLCLGAISSGIASGCIVYEASFLATDVFTSTRGSPATRSLPPSKRMLWFRKHGNARLVLGFPISAWVWLMIGLASAAAALLRFKQPDTDQALPLPLQTEQSEVLAEHSEQQSLAPENSEKENLAPARTVASIEALATDVSIAVTADDAVHGALASLPNAEDSTESPPPAVPVSAEATASCEQGAVATADQLADHSSVHEPEASEPEAMIRDYEHANDDAELAAVDTEAVEANEFSARQELESAGCHPRARFWKHKSFDPSLVRAMHVLDVHSPTADNTTYNEAQSFWKKQAAMRAASSPAGEGPAPPPLDMSAEAVAARARAVSSCCFATNQRPQVPRLRAVPSGPLGPNTPNTSCSSDRRQSDSQVPWLTDTSQPPGQSETNPLLSGPERNFERRKNEFSVSSGGPVRSLRESLSLHHRCSSAGNSTMESPGTPEPGFRTWDLPQRRDTAPACLDTITSVCEEDTGQLPSLPSRSSLDSDWTLSDSEAEAVADSLSLPHSASQSMSLSDANSKAQVTYLPDTKADSRDLSISALHSDADSACGACNVDAYSGAFSMHRSLSQLPTVRVHNHDAEVNSLSGSDTDSTHARDDVRACLDDDSSSVCAMELGDPSTIMDGFCMAAEDAAHADLLCTASSKRSSLISGISAQASLTLSAEALVYESTEGNNPLFGDGFFQLDSHTEARDEEEESGEREAQRELARLFAHGTIHQAENNNESEREHRNMSTGGNMHEHSQGSFEMVQASASCMLEQPLQCCLGSHYVNPPPLLTVDRTPSSSPGPEGVGTAAECGEVVCSPTASVASSSSSVCSVLADALRSAQRSAGSAQQGASEECDAHAGELGPEISCGRELSCEGLRAENSGTGDRDECGDLVRERGDSVGTELCRGHKLLSQPITLHARSRPETPRSRINSALNTGASSSWNSDKEGRVCATEQDAVKRYETPRGVLFGGNHSSEDEGTSMGSDGTPNYFSYPSVVE